MQSGALNIFFWTALFVGLCHPVFGQGANATKELTEDQRFHIAVEALIRLHDVDLEKNPQIKPTIDKILEKTRGTASLCGSSSSSS